MGRLETAMLWPPAGWSQFSAVEHASGQALAKDIGKARIYGLQYRIESLPLFKQDMKLFRHDIRIEGWEYSILNESIEYPVLSLTLLDRFDPSLPREYFISDIRSFDASMPHTKRSADRAVGAGLFLIRQIMAGQVPDVSRVLRIYKLHPSQAFLYRGEDAMGRNLRAAFSDSLARRETKQF